MNKIIITPLICLAITACTPNIIEYDSEKLEAERISKLAEAQKKDPFYNAATKDDVRVADEEDVYIEVHKLPPIPGPNGIKLDTWRAIATNRNDTSKCVFVKWALQDFEFESDQPAEFLIKPKEKLNIAKFRQTIWSFDGAMIAIPPSGYVDTIHVRDADINKNDHQPECVIDESNIQEPPDKQPKHEE